MLVASVGYSHCYAMAEGSGGSEWKDCREHLSNSAYAYQIQVNAILGAFGVWFEMLNEIGKDAIEVVMTWLPLYNTSKVGGQMNKGGILQMAGPGMKISACSHENFDYDTAVAINAYTQGLVLDVFAQNSGQWYDDLGKIHVYYYWVLSNQEDVYWPLMDVKVVPKIEEFDDRYTSCYAYTY